MREAAKTDWDASQASDHIKISDYGDGEGH